MKIVSSIIFVFVFNSIAHADFVLLQQKPSLAESFPVGSGSQYFLNTGLGPAEVNIYVQSVKGNKLAVEMYMRETSGRSPGLYQSFDLELNSSQNVALKDAYLKRSSNSPPERMPRNVLEGTGQWKMSEFSRISPQDLKKDFVKEVELEMEFGKLKTLYFKKEKNGLVLEYWISEKVKPFGLVKMRSQGPKKKDNYTLDFKSLLTGVKSEINPKKAVPLTEEGQILLGLKKPKPPQ